MKKYSRVILFAICIAVTAAAIAFCPVGEASAADSGKGAYIGKIPITLKHDVHGNDAKWAKIYAAEKYGATYEVIDPDQDLNAEIAAVETFISKGVDAIILHPVTEDGVNEIIQEARDAGVYILTYNVEASAKKVPALLIDEAEVAAEMGADMCKQWMELYPDKPVKIGLVSWTDIAFCFDNRSGPFLKGAKTVVDYLPTDDWGFVNSKGEKLTGATYWEHAGGNLELAIQVTSDAIIKHPDVNVIYGDNVSNGLGVVAAYEAAGRGKAVNGIPQTEIIASTDASDGELNKIADPTSSLKYCLGMQPQTFAYAQIDMVMQIINGELDPDTYVVKYTPDVYFNYYKDSLETMQQWYNTQYMPDSPLDIVGTFGGK
jgi:ribose transport system substrate-binding protein